MRLFFCADTLAAAIVPNTASARHATNRITKLRRTIDDQTLLIQSLRLNGTGNNNVIQGSLMNEIADFVASETRDRPPADEPQTPTRRCPPMASLVSDEPPDVAADTMAAAQPQAFASPPFTPAAAESNGATTPASNAAPLQSAAADADEAAAAAIPCSAGSASNSIAVDVSLSPFKSPGTLPAIVGSRPGEGEATLETRMNMYTMALKQHAAGLKIVTREGCAIWPVLPSHILRAGLSCAVGGARKSSCSSRWRAGCRTSPRPASRWTPTM